VVLNLSVPAGLKLVFPISFWFLAHDLILLKGIKHQSFSLFFRFLIEEQQIIVWLERKIVGSSIKKK